MDSLGSEVGQKMRCAVKAKLIELGTGGSSGYIDDELPDYVMIMVANKRSKQQMISDLNLFLGEHTDVFVIWLHEVLQKLQEVTLPTNVVAKGKRKPGENNEITTINKKDKKDKKKDKKQKKMAEKNVLDNSETPSITDVFVDHLLQKTKQTFPIDTSTIKTKQENSEISSYQNQPNNSATDSFDIPTISEIGGNCFSVPSSRERDIAELKDIQKKIYQAKKQLKNFDEHDESEDEDFLNIKEDGEEFDDDVNKFNNNKKNQVKSPIIFEKSPESLNKDNEDKNIISEPRKRIIYQQASIQKRETLRQYDNNTTQKLEKEKSVEKTVYKKSVHERLGLKIQRPNQLSEPHNSLKRKDIEHTYEENKLKERKIESPKDSKRLEKRKLVSKIIVAKSKSNTNNRLSDVEQEQSENENRDNIKSVNSVIKIKPRPTVSPSRQACKNLLLRAVAEAQKSTTVLPNLRRNENINQQYVSNISSASRSQKLYSNSFRNRNRKNLLEHVKKDNIVIEVNSDNFSPTEKYNYERDDEYIPEPISDKGDSESEQIYIPKTIMTEISNNESNRSHQQEPKKNKTQFVVTLDEKTGEKYISRNKNSKQIKEKRKISDAKIQIIKDLVSSNTKKNISLDEVTTEKSDHIKIYKKSNELKKVSTRNVSIDTEIESINLNKNKGKDESKNKTLTPPPPLSVEDLGPSPKKRKRISVSPIKFDLNEIKNEDTSEKMQSEEKNKIVIKKSEYLKKYDRIPELLSNISINRSSVKAKLKERCKYFPSCTNSECEYFHPSGQCKAFPNCKFADNCLYIHPKCKFDLTCNRNGCNFSHTNATATAAPPLLSHVVPVQNYKTITANPITPTMCKYYPNCSNTQCTFFHPKACRFGRNCMNKSECNFYHHEIPSSNKFKWIATSA